MNKFKIIAGPCVIESKELLKITCEKLLDSIKTFEVDFYFKASYRKANRSSFGAFEGVGDLIALEWMKEISTEFKVKTITDIHSPEEAFIASNFVDALQIPAFLSRQTDLLVAAAKTGKTVNIKKAQFMAPDDMKKAAKKVTESGNNNIFLTERGTFFGYHDLVVDFRSLVRMKEFGFPVIYDATHSLQQPSLNEQSGGFRELIPALARGAVAVGIDGVFFETHPNPEKALSDSATQLPLNQASEFIDQIIRINELVSSFK